MNESAVAPDGSPVALYLAFPAQDEPDLIHGALRAGTTILELGCGAGRVTHSLIRLGHEVVGVDQSPEMLVHVQNAEAILADIESLALARQFGGVVLASYLVNTANRVQRARFLATCRRHVADDGRVVIQRFDPFVSWVPGTHASFFDSIFVRLTISKREGPIITAQLDYQIESRTFSQPFTAEILDDAMLIADLAAAGLQIDAWLDVHRTWFTARPLLDRGKFRL